jgi:hypothetical protein
MIIYKDEYQQVHLNQDENVIKDLVYQKVLQWFIKRKAFAGEVIMQNDDSQIESAPLLADIADDIFKCVYND